MFFFTNYDKCGLSGAAGMLNGSSLCDSYFMRFSFDSLLSTHCDVLDIVSQCIIMTVCHTLQALIQHCSHRGCISVACLLLTFYSTESQL